MCLFEVDVSCFAECAPEGTFGFGDDELFIAGLLFL